jgi:hypothetical protein
MKCINIMMNKKVQITTSNRILDFCSPGWTCRNSYRGSDPPDEKSGCSN